MKAQSILVMLFALVAVVFTLFNRAAVFEPRSVTLPGGPYATPVVALTLLAGLVTLGLVLLVGAIGAALEGRARQRVETRLAEREHEIAEMKSRAYDRVSEDLQTFRREALERLAALESRLDAQFPRPGSPAEPSAPAPGPPDPDAAQGPGLA